MPKKHARTIYVTNALCDKLLGGSGNASRLIEEALIFYLNAMQNGLLSQSECNRIVTQELINVEFLAQEAKK